MLDGWGRLLLASSLGWGTLIKYGVCIAVIAIGLICIGLLRRKDRKILTEKSLLNACRKAQELAEKLLNKKNEKLLTPSGKLMKLSSVISDAEWIAVRLVEEKKDISIEGIANDLDGIANEVSFVAKDSFVKAEEYKNCVLNALARLNGTLEQIEELRKTRENTL